MKRYLESSEHINWDTSPVREKASSLAKGKSSDEEIAKACFEFVRNMISEEPVKRKAR